MDIEITKYDNCTEIGLTGSLDAITTPDAEIKFSEIASTTANIAIDMTALKYISSAGLRALLNLGKNIQKQNGKLVLFGLSSQVEEVFNISGFSSIFNIFPDKNTSLAEFVK